MLCGAMARERDQKRNEDAERREGDDGYKAVLCS